MTNDMGFYEIAARTRPVNSDDSYAVTRQNLVIARIDALAARESFTRDEVTREIQKSVINGFNSGAVWVQENPNPFSDNYEYGYSHEDRGLEPIPDPISGRRWYSSLELAREALLNDLRWATTTFLIRRPIPRIEKIV